MASYLQSQFLNTKRGKRSFFLLVSLFLSACTPAESQVQGAEESAEESEDEERLPPPVNAKRVEVALLEQGEVRIELSLQAEVEGYRDTLLSAPAGGLIENVLVSSGDQVDKGKLLARIDSRLYGAQREQAAAALEQARNQWRRIEASGDSVSEADQEQAQSGLRSARAAFRVANLQSSRARIMAPFEGIVADVNIEKGEVAPPGAPLIRLVQLDPILLKLSVSDRDVVALEKGMSASVTLDADRSIYEGKVSNINPAANIQTRTFEVDVEVPNPEHKILPGMIARVRINEPIQSSSLSLPQHLLVTRLNGNGVFVEKDGIAHWRDVEVEKVLGNQVLISSGLSKGEKVVINGHRELVDGDKVIVAREGTCCTNGRILLGDRAR